MRAVALAVVLAACGGDGEPVPVDLAIGHADACLGTAADVIAPDVEEIVYTFGGELEAVDPGLGLDFNLIPCDERDLGATQVAQIKDSNQVRWLLGWVVQNEQGQDQTPVLNAPIGTQVNLLFRAVEGGESAGFVLTESGSGLVEAALEVGHTRNALGAGEVPNTSIWFGSWATTVDLECGTAHGYNVAFESTGDGVVSEVVPVSESEVTIASIGYDATAIAAYEYDSEPVCSGVGNELVWSLFRQPR